MASAHLGAPRLTALGSLLMATVLAVLVPRIEGAGMPLLIGWVGVAVLALSLGVGEPTALVLATVAFMVRMIMLAGLSGPVAPPVWMQAFILVAAVELAAISLEIRVRPRAPGILLARVAMSAAIAGGIALVLESAVYGASGGGLLLRVAAVAAVVVLAGWMIRLWGRAVETR